MPYEIILAPSAIRQLDGLSAHVRSRVRDQIQVHLRHEPTRVSKSRIKRLRGMDRPQYRLRIDEVRVFYDVHQDAVEILAIVTKDEADAWLEAEGTTAEAGGPR